MTMRSTGKKMGQSVFAWILLAACVLVVLYAAITPPQPLPENAPATAFSGTRALRLARQLSVDVPHPAGSPDLVFFRSRLLDRMHDLGMEVEAHEATVVTLNGAEHSIEAGPVTNVVGRLRGSASTRPVVLTASYDSVEGSPQASAVAGIAVLLETVRALKAGPPLRNDVVLILTDGQQSGARGVRTIVENAGWLTRVGFIVDLHSRGGSGMPMLWRTTDGNHRLLDLFQKAAPYPAGSSFLYEMSDLLDDPPAFDTYRTLNVVPGVSLGMLGGAETNRTGMDTTSRVSAGALQALGSNTLGLAQASGGMDLTAKPPAVAQERGLLQLVWPSHGAVSAASCAAVDICGDVAGWVVAIGR